MVLVIKHLSEPHAGREVTLAADAEEVRFGRDPAADIGFPAELDIVGRDHFRLRREVGTWKFVISKQRPVFSGGRALIDGEELDGAMEVQLSGPGGPRLRIEPQAGTAGNIPKTRVLAGGQDIGDVADASRRGGRRLAIGLGAVAVAVAFVAGGYFLLRGNVAEVSGQMAGVSGEVAALGDQISATAAKIPTLEQQVAAAEASAGKQIDAQAILGRFSRSVYVVAWQMSGGSLRSMATASVVLMPDGTKALMTNAHVSEPLETNYLPYGDNVTVWAIQPLAPDYPKLKVVAARTHPAYAEFGKVTERWDALRAENRMRNVRIQFTAYDVGLLFVDHPEMLADPLPLASAEELAALEPGVPLVMTGYPEGGVAGTDTARPEPTAHVGTITAITTFYLFRSATIPNQLIQHALPTAGGASGSPMFNAQGHVVALHDATGSSELMAALINYGQRIDLLTDMMTGEADKKMPAYRAEWAAEEQALTKADPETIVRDLKTDFGNEAQAEVEDAGQEDFPLTDALPDAPHALGAKFDVAIAPGYDYLLVARSQDGRPLMASAYVGNEKQLGSVGGYTLTSLMMHTSGRAIDKVTVALLDQSSLESANAKPGTVTVHLWRARVSR